MTRVRIGPAQIYRYDAQAGQLLRVSIGERGYNDNGNTGEGEAKTVSAEACGMHGRPDPSMSDDGQLVFFQSPTALTPRALNDVPVNKLGNSESLAANVYEWEADGKGACVQPAGCVFLISDGLDVKETSAGGRASASAVELVGSDATGANVFFSTDDPLVAQDTDTELDIYDARVGGGFPAPSPAGAV